MPTEPCRLSLAAGVLWAVLPFTAPAAPAPGGQDQSPVSPIEKAREGLERRVTLRIDRQSLSAAVALLREKTKLKLTVDTQALLGVGINPDQPPTLVDVDLKEVKARSALRTVLEPYGLTFAAVGDTVVISTAEMAAARQMSQRVSMSFDKVELAAALKQIARDTGVNLALDPRAEKEASGKVSLQVEDLPLETAVRLLAEMAGLKPVRAGNTLFVTKKEVAAELRADPELNPGPRKDYFDNERDFVFINGLNNARVWQVRGQGQGQGQGGSTTVTEPSQPKQPEASPPADPKDADPPPAKDGDK